MEFTKIITDIFQIEMSNELISLRPIKKNDFELLYRVASDPLIWEQHPKKDRYKREVFENFFKGAIESNGAYVIFENKSDKAIGSSRFYNYDSDRNSVAIGYTFLARENWGTTYNRSLKNLMLDHAFKYVDNVYFHIGANNVRSQKAIEKLGALKIEEKDISYYGEENNLNFVYLMSKDNWHSKKQNLH